MRAGDIISTHISVVDVGSTVRDCLDVINENGLDSMVVVKDGVYYGVITKQQCAECADADTVLGDIALRTPAVQSNAHIIEALGLLTDHSLRNLAVVDVENHYIGSITSADVLQAVSTICNATHPGAVIELEMLPEDYYITEISRLIEDNHCKLITLFSYPHPTTGMLHLLIRTNCEDATAILQSFERYGYRVIATYYPQGRIDERAEQRLRELMYYLEM